MSHDIWFLNALIRKALSSAIKPTRINAVRWEWDIAGRCEAPASREFFARPPDRRSSHRPDWGFIGIDEPPGPGQPLTLLMFMQCRKCRYCLWRRSAQWRDRARLETDMAARTWFATWTLHPDRQHHYLSMARAALSAQRTDFEEIGPAEQFQRLCWQIGRQFTLGFKRLRKNAQAEVRYLIVAERHKSGAPHFHGLIHEQHGSPPVTHASLVRDLWHYGEKKVPEGFVKYKLCDTATASYVTKYLSKAAEARVRASLRYGKPALAIASRLSGCVNTSTLSDMKHKTPPF